MASTLFKVSLVALYLNGVTAASVSGILDQHNAYRAPHDADPLTYSAALEVYAQDYANVLASDCGSLIHDPNLGTLSHGENLASCSFIGSNPDCVDGSDATPRWYDEVQFYVPGATGTTDTPGEAIGHFTQVVWKSSTELGCASSACEYPYTGSDSNFEGVNWQRTYVVCRYTPPGNYIGQYYDNVSILCDDISKCDTTRGEICCPTKKVCEIPDAATPNACGDPHMTGFKGQKFDFTGEDGGWYSVISDMSDQADQPSTHVNMRVTSPVPSMPEITYITGLSVITTDADGLDHSIVIRVTDPHTLESSCPAGMSPCLADGALTVEIDGAEELLAPGTVEVGSGVAVSAVNLPGACRSFGFEKYWEAKQEEIAQAGRKLGVFTDLQDMAEWILGDPTATNMDECAEYAARATAASGEDGLFAHDSEHASFQIMTPGAVIRLSHGRLHQLPTRDPTDQFDLPDHLTWQMNLALEHNGLRAGASGILGETQVPTVDANGQPIMQGMESIRGTQEDYRVEGPLDIAQTEKQHDE